MCKYLVKVFDKGVLIAEVASNATEALGAIAYAQSELDIPTFMMRGPDGVVNEYIEPQYYMEAQRL